MGSVFGKHKSKVTDQDRAVLRLKQQKDRLRQYTRRIEGQLVRDRSVAKQLLKDGKKEKALLLLKKKHCLEKLIDDTEKKLRMIDQLVDDIEFSQIQVDVLNRLSAGNDALKDIHRIMSLDDVERIMDETRESMAYQQEIDSAIAGFMTPTDTRDAESELDELLRSINLPDVPTHELPSGESEQRERSPAGPSRHAARTAPLLES